MDCTECEASARSADEELCVRTTVSTPRTISAHEKKRTERVVKQEQNVRLLRLPRVRDGEAPCQTPLRDRVERYSRATEGGHEQDHLT